MQLFYSENIDNNTIVLNEEESRHCGKVLRKKNGDIIEVVDGKGNYYEAIIIDENYHKVVASIYERISNWKVKPYQVSLAVAVAKNHDRFEWLCEKVTEIGVNTIIPIITERTELQQIKKERLEKILLSAMKQSGKSLMPVLQKPIFLNNFLQGIAEYNNHQKFIGWCETDESVHLKNLYQTNENALILIGPEGDFTDSEVTLAQQQGFKAVNLGSSRLRLETAAIVACHIVHLCNE